MGPESIHTPNDDADADKASSNPTSLNERHRLANERHRLDELPSWNSCALLADDNEYTESAVDPGSAVSGNSGNANPVVSYRLKPVHIPDPPPAEVEFYDPGEEDDVLPDESRNGDYRLGAAGDGYELDGYDTYELPEDAYESPDDPYELPEEHSPDPVRLSDVEPSGVPGPEPSRLSGDGFALPEERLSGDGFGGTNTAALNEEMVANGWEEFKGVTDDAAPAMIPDGDADELHPKANEQNLTALDLRDRVVIMLLFKQIVQIEHVEKAWRRWQAQTGGKSGELLWRVLTMDPAFDREQIFAEAAQVYAFKRASVEKANALKFIKKHEASYAEPLWDRMRKLRVVPIRHEAQARSRERRVIFISHDPSRPDVNRLMRDLRLESYELQYAPEAQIDRLIAEAFPKRNEFLDRVSDDDFAFDLGTTYDQESGLIDEDALEAEISRSSLINLFEASLVEAVRRGVSDIHIFPNPRKQIEIHFRVDGELECWHREERVRPEAFLAVVKDNTLNVDRFERDAAQDGFIQRKIDDTLIRYRVSVLPVANANQELRSESIVIRVLDDRNVITDLRRLGLLERAREKFEWAITQPYGMVILTGPTGSGKTTTLFAALSQVVTPKRNVLTVEDPVEYVIPGVRQIKLSHKLVLEQALRSILRHDPDVVMVGEMRDRETAELAIKLANTGHLTFSTLHTNDAPSAISRLYKMGIEPFLIAYAINLIVAQRLIRTLCPHCKRPQENVDHETLGRLGFTLQERADARFFDEGRNPNCKACGGTGYKGRRAITETMAFSDDIRRLIVTADHMIDEDAIRRQADAEGMLSLRASAREVVKHGETSILELIRTTAGEH